MTKRTLDALSLVGLAVSLTAVCDMLGRFESKILNSLYLIWGVACMAAVALVLLSYKARTNFHETCRGGSRLLWLRLAVSVLVFLLGWYVNAASVMAYGQDGPLVADNGIRMFSVIFTMVAHVFYFGFTKKKHSAPGTGG